MKYICIKVKSEKRKVKNLLPQSFIGRWHSVAVAIFSLFTLSAILLTACVKEDTYDNSRRGNFEALWKAMDEHYCFFSYKRQQLGVDWDEVHTRYASQVNEDMNSTQLFEVLCNMIAELQDGHVNLSSPFDYGRNWSFFEDHPENYNDSIARLYLGHNYQIASGLKYIILDDNIGYVRCETFEDGIGDGNVSVMLNSLALCNGLIIDVRGNGGGQLTKAQTLASHFTNERRLIGYISHKTGKGRNDFSTPDAQYLDPASDGVRWQKPVVVLTNRAVFSAANDFVKCMKQCPNVTIMGDQTGGGSGMPFNSELPNGWTVRYSAVVLYDRDMQHTEFGIAPDIQLSMSGADLAQHKDTYIEAARKYLAE
ncbi:MAG: S41 family peptidase [Bacteroidaceae bacterium]|nr:S41 family peptidase [Bacteroidaceae bacterium]